MDFPSHWTTLLSKSLSPATGDVCQEERQACPRLQGMALVTNDLLMTMDSLVLFWATAKTGITRGGAEKEGN